MEADSRPLSRAEDELAEVARAFPKVDDFLSCRGLRVDGSASLLGKIDSTPAVIHALWRPPRNMFRVSLDWPILEFTSEHDGGIEGRRGAGPARGMVKAKISEPNATLR